MLKLLGSLCILAGGWLVRREQVSACRRELDTLSDLLAALEAMGQEIRMARTPLPLLLDRLKRGRTASVAAFFAGASAAAKRGESVADAWLRGAEALPLDPEDRGALAECGASLGGDEERVTQGIALARMRLGRSLEEKRRERAEREKRVTALSLSGAALLVILLI